jgi:hypothetical protein
VVTAGVPPPVMTAPAVTLPTPTPEVASLPAAPVVEVLPTPAPLTKPAPEKPKKKAVEKKIARCTPLREKEVRHKEETRAKPGECRP